MLTNLRESQNTVQAGTPMTVTGETLLRLLTGAGRPVSLSSVHKYPMGVRGCEPPALATSAEVGHDAP